jgi:hypothetical protein
MVVANGCGMKINLSDLYATDALKACKLSLRRTINLPERERLEAIDKLLGMHGIEAIRGEWQNGYWCDIVACYCNAGDTYSTTVIQVRGNSQWNNSRFFVGNWGDFVERNQTRYGIQ